MKLVGDAIKDDHDANEIVVLGIAPWGCITFKDELANKINENPHAPVCKIF
jgi:hypothetical protein